MLTWLIEIMATFVWPLKGSLWLLQWSLCTQVVTSSFISPVRAHWAGSSILLSGRGVTTHTKPPHQCYYWSTKVFWDFFLSFQRLPWYNLEIFCSDESLDHYHTLIPSVCGDATDARLQKLKVPWYAWGLLAPWHVTFRWCSVFFFFFSGGGLLKEVVHRHSSAVWCPNCSKVWNSKASSGTATLPCWQIYKPRDWTVCHHIQKGPIKPENAENHECHCLGLKATVTLCEEFRCETNWSIPRSLSTVWVHASGRVGKGRILGHDTK